MVDHVHCDHRSEQRCCLHRRYLHGWDLGTIGLGEVHGRLIDQHARDHRVEQPVEHRRENEAPPVSPDRENVGDHPAWGKEGNPSSPDGIYPVSQGAPHFKKDQRYAQDNDDEEGLGDGDKVRRALGGRDRQAGQLERVDEGRNQRTYDPGQSNERGTGRSFGFQHGSWILGRTDSLKVCRRKEPAEGFALARASIDPSTFRLRGERSTRLSYAGPRSAPHNLE